MLSSANAIALKKNMQRYVNELDLIAAARSDRRAGRPADYLVTQDDQQAEDKAVVDRANILIDALMDVAKGCGCNLQRPSGINARDEIDVFGAATIPSANSPLTPYGADFARAISMVPRRTGIKPTSAPASAQNGWCALAHSSLEKLVRALAEGRALELATPAADTPMVIFSPSAGFWQTDFGWSNFPETADHIPFGETVMAGFSLPGTGSADVSLQPASHVDSFDQTNLAHKIADALSDISDGHDVAAFCNEKLGMPCQYEDDSLWTVLFDESQSMEDLQDHVVAMAESLDPEVAARIYNDQQENHAAFYSGDEIFYVVKIDPAFPVEPEQRRAPALSSLSH